MLRARKKLFSQFSIWLANYNRWVIELKQDGEGGAANQMWSLGEQESRGLLTACSP